MDSIFDMLHSALSNAWLYGATFLLVLGVLVFVHEWGHFIVARLCGVKVDVFSVGFGREIYGWTAKSGTRWKISLFPLGGYVKMFGDSDPASADFTDEVEENGVVRHMTEEERKGAFFAKPVWQRALIVFAGPAINFLFAILVLSVLYFSIGRPVTPPQISGIEVGGSADAADFMPHDYIKQVNGEDIDSFREVRRKVILTLDEPMEFVVLRDGKEVAVTATPKRVKDVDRFGFTSEYGLMGFVGPAEGVDIAAISKVGEVNVAGNIELAHAELLKNLGGQFKIDHFAAVKTRRDRRHAVRRQIFLGFARARQQQARVLDRQRLELGRLEDPAEDPLIEVVAAERRIAAGRQHFENAF